MSWSGARSKAVAELLDDWLQCVIQAVQPWMSARDIDRGSLWFTEIADQLKDVTAGIVCLTRENRDRPWILFEAGALARGLSSQRVLTFLIDLQPTDVGDPLAQFNHTLPDESGLRSLVTTINSRLGERAVTPRTLESVFETYWPQFKEKFASILETIPTSTTEPIRGETSLLEELVERVRQIEFQQRHLLERSNSTIYSKKVRKQEDSSSYEDKKSGFSFNFYLEGERSLQKIRDMIISGDPNVSEDNIGTFLERNGFTPHQGHQILTRLWKEGLLENPPS